EGRREGRQRRRRESGLPHQHGRDRAAAAGSRRGRQSVPEGWQVADLGTHLQRLAFRKGASRFYFRRLLSTSGFTQAGNFGPVTPAIRLLAQICAIALRVPIVALAMCGAITAFGSRRSESPGAGGSGSVTSSPAAKMVPAFNASASAF